MGLDLLVEATSNVASALLPIVAVIALIFLIILLYHLIKVVKKSSSVMDDISLTLQSANRQLNALEGPLHTLNELSETVDHVHEVSNHLIRSALVAIVDNLAVIRDWVFHKVNRNSSNDEDLL